MPSETNDRTLKTGLAVVSVLVLAYSLVIQGSVLVGVLAVLAIWVVYLFYRLILVLARIAGALEQLVRQRTDAVSGARTAETTESSANEQPTSERSADASREPEREI